MFSRGNLPRSFAASSSKTPVIQTPSRPLLHRGSQRRLDAECSKSPLRRITTSLSGFRQVRWNSSSSKPEDPTQSIFNTPDSPWERLFSGPEIHPQAQKGPEPPARRVEMTTKEQKAFTDLFDEIFRVAEAVDASKSSGEGEDGSKEGFLSAPAFSSDFYKRIRRAPGRPKWNDNLNEELDRKKEEMDFCRTDQELLEWALVEVFAASQRWEEEAREMSPEMRTQRNITLQPAWYPHVIAFLMGTFRDKYQNPHTALAIFNHTKMASIASYAFGCSTDAYNELIQTYWTCFRDATAALNALREMQVNGVTMNAKTGRLMDTIRRDTGAEKLWSEDEMSKIITRLDGIRRDTKRLEETSKKFKGRQRWDQWKTQNFQDDPSDNWGFNSWGNSSTTGAEMS